jgi:hypothetical protein
METITLTQKDADFILAYIRANTARMNRNYDEMVEKNKAFEERAKLVDPNDPFVIKIREVITNATDEYQKLYKVQSDIAVKCIELLTTGSADV